MDSALTFSLRFTQQMELVKERNRELRKAQVALDEAMSELLHLSLEKGGDTDGKEESQET